MLRCAMLLLAVSCPLHAQCTIGNSQWPRELRIEPQPASPGVPLEMVTGPPGYIWSDADPIVWNGSNIRVSGRIRSFLDIGIPPPPFVVRIPIGPLPEGRYTLTYAPRGDYVCTPMTISFQVGTAHAAEPVPISPRIAAVLALLILLVGGLRLRSLRA